MNMPPMLQLGVSAVHCGQGIAESAADTSSAMPTISAIWDESRMEDSFSNP